MPKSRIYPPLDSAQLPGARELSDEDNQDNLVVYSSLEGLEESDNDIKSIIVDQLRKYRNLSVRIRNDKNGQRLAVLTFRNFESYNFFKRSILDRRDRVVVYDRVLFFNFNRDHQTNPRMERNRSYARHSPDRIRDYYDRKIDRNNNVRRQQISISRTLFVGNLDDHVEPEDVKKLFSPHGELLEVVIKHPNNSRSAPYAFVKFRKLSDAMNARDQLHDTYLGQTRLKIGFGKVSPGHGLWIGGLNDQTTEEELTSEVRRVELFSAHEFRKQDNIAYFVFDTIRGCQKAYETLRDTKLVHSGVKLEVDYADSHTEVRELLDKVRLQDTRRYSRSSSPVTRNPRRYSRSPLATKQKYKQRHSLSSSSSNSPRPRSPLPTMRRSNSNTRFKQQDENHISASRKLEDTNNRSSSISTPTMRRPIDTDGDIQDKNKSSKVELPQLVLVYPIVWKGSVSVKASVCPIHLHLVCGSVDPVSTMVHQATLKGLDATHIHLTSRFPLLPDRIKDLRSKLATAIASRDSCILVAQPSDDSASGRLLASLASYFQQKQAAGIGLIGSTSIYAFPPSPFTQEQLSTLMPHAVQCLSTSTDNYLMVVISR